MPDIAVVIPCRNAEKFLTETLTSVGAQTRQPSQVVLVDDGSTDRSAEIARAFPFVTLVQHVTNLGIAEASNTGLDASTAPLVAFLDADDVWHPTHLDTVAGLLEASPDAGWAFSASKSFGSGSIYGLNRIWGKSDPCLGPTDLWTACFDTILVSGSTGIVRRTALDAIKGFGADPALRVAPDYDLWLRLALHGAGVWTPTVTVRYRKHPGQMSYRYALGQWEAVYASRFAVTREAQRRQDPRAEAMTERLRQRFVRDYRTVAHVRDHRRETILEAFLCNFEMRRIMQYGDEAWFPGVEAEMFEEETAKIRARWEAANGPLPVRKCAS